MLQKSRFERSQASTTRSVRSRAQSVPGPRPGDFSHFIIFLKHFLFACNVDNLGNGSRFNEMWRSTGTARQVQGGLSWSIILLTAYTWQYWTLVTVRTPCRSHVLTNNACTSTIYQSNHPSLKSVDKPRNNVKIIFKWLIFDLSRGLLSTVLCIIIRASVVLTHPFIMT